MQVPSGMPEGVQEEAKPAEGEEEIVEIANEKEALKLKIRLAKLKEKYRIYQEQNKAQFIKFLPYQQKIIDFIKAGKKTILMVTGNRGGKTTLGSVIVALLCVPELRDKLEMSWLDDFFPRKNGRIRILCKDWEHFAAQVMVPCLKEWIPVGTYETKKNNVGVEAFWTFKSGWTIEFITNVQATENQEGWKGHLVWQDETTTRDKYVTNKRGLIDYKGVYLMTFTAVDTSWVLDDIVLSQDEHIGCLTGISSYENTYLDKEEIEAFERTLTDRERIARIKGEFLNLEGRVWKLFDKDKHTVKPFKVPPDWPVTFQVDFHPSESHAMAFFAVDPWGRRFLIKEIWEHLTNEQIADEIIKAKISNTWRMKYGEIDALSKGDSSYVRNRFGKTEDSYYEIERKLSKNGIRLGVGSKAEKNYIAKIDEWLRHDPVLFFVFDDCIESIKQIMKWTYEELDKGHFPECIGRFSQMGLKYTAPELYTKPLEYAPIGV